MEMPKQRAANSHRWSFESHNYPRTSLWLLFILVELAEKTKAMLELIEPDADSFAGRAEMYYKKRPELISMVEDLHRAHGSLAERYNQIQQHDRGRHTFSIQKVQSPREFDPCKFHVNYTEEAYCSNSSNESQVDDSVQEDPEPVMTFINTRKEQLSSNVGSDETSRLVQEINTLREQNKLQRDQLAEKERGIEELMWNLSVANNELMRLGEDFEKFVKVGMQQDKPENIIWSDSSTPKDQDKTEISFEAIRQLSNAVEMPRDENETSIRPERSNKKRSSTQTKIFKGGWGKLFRSTPCSQIRTLKEEKESEKKRGLMSQLSKSMMRSSTQISIFKGGWGKLFRPTCVVPG